jgi:hypothetical protein
VTEPNAGDIFIAKFQKALRDRGWSEEKIQNLDMKVEVSDDGQHVRASLHVCGKPDDSGLSALGEAASGDEAVT